MNVGVVHETRNQEHRVALNPSGVKHLTNRGINVFLQNGAGVDSGWSDEKYIEAGATIVYSCEEVYGRSNVILKISPLELDEIDYIQQGQIIFSWHHLVVRHNDIIQALVEKEATAIGYEIIEKANGNRPIVSLVADIAGYMAVSTSIHYLQNEEGGRAKIIAGIPGVPQGSVAIIGAGLVGYAATKAGIGNGAYVVVLDTDLEKLRKFDEKFGSRITTYYANKTNLAKTVQFSDIVIASAASPGSIAPKVVSEEMVKNMKYRAIVADLSIDQGGCVETSHPTNLANPTFIKHDVVHYCVPNMTANVSRTTSNAISNAILKYLDALNELGEEKAIKNIKEMKNGTFIFKGKCVKKYIAERFELEYLFL